MEKSDHLIWSNYDLNYDDWKDDLEVYYPYMSEEERTQVMYETNDSYLEDERLNLDIQLSRPILVIADLGRWNGRVMGYKEIESGNVRDCLYSDTDYSTWYVDKYGDLRCIAVHHDGTNYYLYRTYKDCASKEQIEQLKWGIYKGEATRADITRLTCRLGDEIGKVYGWTFPKIQRMQESCAR